MVYRFVMNRVLYKGSLCTTFAIVIITIIYLFKF